MTTTSMTTASLLEAYNRLAEKPLKSWKGSREKLIEKIAYARNLRAGKRVDAPSEVEAPKAKKAEAAKKPDATRPEAPSRSGRTIREASEELLLHVVEKRDGRSIGYTYEEILDKVMAEFPGVETTVACLRWYAVHLNKQPEVRMPVRPRKRVKRGKDKAA